MRMFKAWVGVVAVVVGLFGALSDAEGATAAKGSFFASSVVSGADTNMNLTNVFWIPIRGVTNVPVAVAPGIPVAGCGDVGIMCDLVSTNGTGQTNDMGVRFCLQLSQDGVKYTTASNGIWVEFKSQGTTQVIAATNVAASALSGFEYMRLGIVATTNLGGYYISNLTYRLVR